jgi:hypothetical protein
MIDSFNPFIAPVAAIKIQADIIHHFWQTVAAEIPRFFVTIEYSHVHQIKL